ncbi:MAG: glycosyltransferase family 39 protein [Polyangiaceae bacterium]
MKPKALAGAWLRHELAVRGIATVASLFVLVWAFARPSAPAKASPVLDALLPWATLAILSFLGFLPACSIRRGVDVPLARRLPWRPLASVAVSTTSFVVVVRLTVSGTLGRFGGAFTSVFGTMMLLGVVASLVAMARARNTGATRTWPVWAWVMSVGVALGFPMLGAYGLTDPWETHYAEVAREILARDDAISPWWANEGWFHSKPVLLFWLESISMRLFGAGFRPGEVLPSIHAQPEWAVRLPNFLCAVIGSAVLAEGVAHRLGRRAGLIGGVILWLCPFYLLMARQAITDMPLTAGIEASCGFLLLRTSHVDEVASRPYAIGGLVFEVAPSWPLTFFASFLLTSQVAYVTSRGGIPPFAIHRDLVRAGSFGTCGILPDHPPCTPVTLHAPWLTPYVQGTLFGIFVLYVFQEFAGTRSRNTLLFYAASLTAAAAAMAKGPLGLVLPTSVFLADVVSRKRFEDLALSSERLTGLTAAALAILPWYVALYARHGRLFYDDLVLRHMFGRALEHLHDVNELEDTGLRYYLAQLGYGALPLVAMLPAAIVGALRDARRLSLLVWAGVAFAIVTSMKTKFHHYVFPVVPPLAMLVGVECARARTRGLAAVVGGVCALFVVSDLATMRGSTFGPSRFIALLCYRYDRAWPLAAPLQAGKSYLAVLVLTALCILFVRFSRGRVAVAVLAAPLALYLSFVYAPLVSQHFGQRPAFEAFVARTRFDPGSREPALAYHLNWKGENYYSGNQIALFIHGGAAFSDYLMRRRAAGISVFYVATEWSSLASLRTELGVGATMQPVTSESDGNRFCLVRVTFPTAPP